MSLSYGQIRQWRSEPLDAAATALRANSDTLVGLADEFDAMGGPKNWIGEQADNATKKRGEITVYNRLLGRRDVFLVHQPPGAPAAGTLMPRPDRPEVPA